VHARPRAPPAFPYEFDPEARLKARRYERGSRRIGLVFRTLVPLAFAALFWASGASRWLADAAARATGGSVLAADTLYIVVFALAFAALTLPFAYYSGHLREKRWGMTRRRARDFAADSLKSVLLGVAFALALLLPFFFLARRFELWWLAASGVYALYLVFSYAVLPNLILPVFYKLEPLPDGELKAAILDVASRSGAPPIREVAVMAESAKSPRANAFIHGLGATRRIVLYDTLIADFHPREVRFTIAHEVAHLAHRDVPRSFAIAVALVAPEMWLLSLALAGTQGWFGVAGAHDLAVVPLLLLVASGINFLDGVAFSSLSRRQEARADASALEVTQDPLACESMMKRLCDRNLIDESPNPLVERLLYTHPAPARRIQAAREFVPRDPSVPRQGHPASTP
jgi:STE24 endopeptidase